MLRNSVIAAVLSASFAGAVAAPATTPLTATQVLNQMNAVSLTSITANSGGHVHGRTWAAGSVAGGEYGNQLGNAPASDYAGLTAASVSYATTPWGHANVMINNGGMVVGGPVNGVTVNTGSSVVHGNASGVIFNGAAYVAGNATNTTFNRGGQVTGTLTNSRINGGTLGGMTDTMRTNSAAATSTDFGKVLNQLSSTLAKLESTGSTVAINGSKATFTARADASGVAVFDLTGFDDNLFTLNEFQFNLNGATTVIMNSDVTTATIHANFLGNGARDIARSVIWNFYDATSLTLASSLGGAVLATDALVTNTRDIEGGLFARELNLQAQVHVQPFTGNVDFLSPVPEPSIVAMIMAGLAVLGIGLRRRTDKFAR